MLALYSYSNLNTLLKSSVTSLPILLDLFPPSSAFAPVQEIMLCDSVLRSDLLKVLHMHHSLRHRNGFPAIPRVIQLYRYQVYLPTHGRCHTYHNMERQPCYKNGN